MPYFGVPRGGAFGGMEGIRCKHCEQILRAHCAGHESLEWLICDAQQTEPKLLMILDLGVLVC